jgi:ABC-type dipeptide/oligopeptide/nickel transport system permease component
MSNPMNAFIDEAKDTFVLVITAIIAFIVLGVIGATLGMQAITDQMINSIAFFVLLVLAIPSTALIIFIIWIFKKLAENTGDLSPY